MRNNNWTEFWLKYTQDSDSKDEQVQVLRTKNKSAIDATIWHQTLLHISKFLCVTSEDSLLDLGSGNGLVSAHFAPHAKSVTAVDISDVLLENFSKRNLTNVEFIKSDIRELVLEDESHSRILMYACTQYFTKAEIIIILRKVFNWLKPGGIFFMGDIPDNKRIWNFYHNSDLKKQYFINQLSENDVIGTWFDQLWMINLLEDIGFKNVEIILQPEYQIYSNYRFDIVSRK